MKFRLLNHDGAIVIFEGILQNVVRFPNSIYFAGGFYLWHGLQYGRAVYVAIDCYFIPAAPYEFTPALIQPPEVKPHEPSLNHPNA